MQTNGKIFSIIMFKWLFLWPDGTCKICINVRMQHFSKPRRILMTTFYKVFLISNTLLWLFGQVSPRLIVSMHPFLPQGHKKVGALWREAGLNWSDFLSEEQELQSFISEQVSQQGVQVVLSYFTHGHRRTRHFVFTSFPRYKQTAVFTRTCK